MPQARLQRLADRLGLQGEVRERFIAQQRSFFLATAHDRQRLRRIHAELRRELASPEPDRARTDRLTEEASRTYLELERAMVANVLTTREMLDPEQERLFLEFVGRRGPGRFAAPDEGERRFPPRRRRLRRFFERP
jgi:Spy/CpxP family protein refolding chaperone